MFTNIYIKVIKHDKIYNVYFYRIGRYEMSVTRVRRLIVKTPGTKNEYGITVVVRRYFLRILRRARYSSYCVT